MEIDLPKHVLSYEPIKIDNVKTYLKKQDYRAKDKSVVCYTCNGRGVAYNPKHRDPIEGWKMASLEACHMCGGSGRLPVNHAIEDFLSLLERHNKQVDNWNKSAMFLNELRDQITPAMRKKIGLSKAIKIHRKVEYRT